MRAWLLIPMLLGPSLSAWAEPILNGSPSSLSLPKATADYIGQRLMATLRAENALLDDPVSQQIIQHFGQDLAKHSPTQHAPYHYFILSHDSINAFAAPGGRIAVFSGLIEAADNASELAGVLAHEDAHLSQHHMARMLARQRENMIPSAIGMIAAIAAASRGHAEAASAALMAGQAQSLTQQMRQNRGLEQEADRIGMQTLHQAGYSPDGMPTFLKRLQQQTLAYQSHRDGLASHPLLNERIADTSNRAMQYPQQATYPSLMYQMMRIRVSVIRSQRDATPDQWECSKKLPLNMQNTLQRYHEAYSALHHHQLDRAKTLLQALPANPIVTYDLAMIDYEQHHPGHAIAALQANLSDPALRAPSLWLIAQCEAQQHQLPEAIHALKQAIDEAAEEPSWYTQLAMLQAQNHQLAQAYLSQSKAYALNLNLNGAIIQIKEALKRQDLSKQDRTTLHQAQLNYEHRRQDILRILHNA